VDRGVPPSRPHFVGAQSPFRTPHSAIYTGKSPALSIRSGPDTHYALRTTQYECPPPVVTMQLCNLVTPPSTVTM
jgi:hypothetical protein